ncbi:MAG: glutamine-hydrolyzing GMP synthase [Gemmatimonadales bacterium]|jgi:GMP synthase (glutamine-hydrolysing)|nr:MAG: glutamine-hydrolyzing GMP synthase [Gemmatimonadales bacterium]
MQHDAIAVVDFGGQYAHLIATKVRRLGVLAEIRQPEDPIEAFQRYCGIILSGSPALSSHGEDSDYTKALYELDVPILGLCFGHQEIAKHYGGEVVHGGREWGHADLHILRDHPLFKGLGPVEQVWMSHFDSVAAVGPEFEELGYTTSKDGSPDHRFAAIGSDSLRRYGFQYHAEVDDTLHGDQMLGNFVLEICRAEPTWSMEAFMAEEREKLQAQVGVESVFLLASGGVDSTVAAVVLKEALGPDRVHLLHIDNGLMRKDESRKVVDMFQRLGLGEHLHFVDASNDFLAALEGLAEPEAKRKAIGNTFVEVFNREAEALGIQDHLLGQGTIYPDTVETGGTKRADVIKTHHNRVEVIEEMIAQGKVVEPLAELYKVEVRELGESLGIAHEALWRHPFPGPGLGVRCLCSDGVPDTDDFERLTREVALVADQFALHPLVLPIRSVGVKADLRAYEHPVLFSGEADWPTLLKAASTVTANVLGINRCIWNLGPGHPESAHPVPGYMTRQRLDLLREADSLVMEGLRRHGIYDDIWQCPTVLVPLSLGGGDEEGETIVLRPIYSARAMTATPVRLPDALLDELRTSILALPGVTGLALDITSKPPGTIEWE